jgi:RNase P subunit RPR2
VYWKSREARNAYQRAYRLKRGMKPRLARPRERITCVECDAPLKRNAAKYCSLRCMQTRQYRAYVDRWLAGEMSGGTVAGVSDRVRRYLIEQAGEQCSRCGWAERHPITGRVPLEIDHINGDWADHSRGNVRLVCANCHSLTPSFRALNKGKSRPWTMVRREA